MKKLIVSAIALLSLCAYAPAQNIEGQVVVSQFAQWQLAGQQSLVSGSNTVVPFGPCQAFAGGKTFNTLAASTPVRIVDPGNSSIDETITPTSIVVSATGCTATLAPTNAHPVPYYLTSGTAGLQEAINANKTSGTLNTAILNQAFYALGGTSSIISAAAGSASLTIVDQSLSPYISYRWNGTNYLTNSTNTGGTKPTAAAGAAAGTSPTISDVGIGNSFTVLLTSGTATTTGTLFTATWTASQFGSGVAPNCSVTSVGNNFAPTFTFAASTTPVLTVTASVAPAVSTAYAFQVNCD